MSWSGLPQRIEDKIIPEPNTGCWLWNAAQDHAGYGLIRWERRTRPAHRVVYAILKGLIPEGLFLDHFKCEMPCCVNPDHVRPATSQENTIRSDKTVAGKYLARTHCAQGHPLDTENGRQEGRTRARVCRACKTAVHQAWLTKNRDKAVQYSTAWRERNRDKVNAYRRAHYQKLKAAT